MAQNFETKAATLTDTDLDTVHAGASRPRTSSGFSDVSGLGVEVNYSEYRDGTSRRSAFLADLFNEPHD